MSANNYNLITDLACKRSEFLNQISYKVPVISDHWCIIAYFNMVFKGEYNGPQNHWLSEVVGRTQELSKITIKGETSDKRNKAILQAFEKFNLLSEDNLLDSLSTKYSQEIANSRNKAIETVGFDQNIGRICVRCFLAVLQLNFVDWVSYKITDYNTLYWGYKKTLTNVGIKFDTDPVIESIFSNEDFVNQINRIKELF